MPELALDDVQRHALAGELQGVRVAQLVRRKPAPDAGAGGDPPKLGADGGARPRSSAGRAVDDAQQRPDRQSARAPATGRSCPSPTRPCRPHAGGRPCRGGPAATRAARRGRARRARAPPGCAARRARARRSSRAAASRAGRRWCAASRPRSHRPWVGRPGSGCPCSAADGRRDSRAWSPASDAGPPRRARTWWSSDLLGSDSKYGAALHHHRPASYRLPARPSVSWRSGRCLETPGPRPERAPRRSRWGRPHPWDSGGK